MNQQPEPQTQTTPQPDPTQDQDQPRFNCSDETREELTRYYLRLSNSHKYEVQKKKLGLRMLGVSEREIKQLCEPSISDKVKFDLQCEQYCGEKRRELAQYNRYLKKQQKLDELREKCRAKYYP
jgi:hypothetical protein